MNKSIHFSGQPTFVQIIQFIPKDLVLKAVRECHSDYCYKRFNTWTHLITMIFSCCAHCDSLRELVTGMRALEGKLNNCGLKVFPARSTLSEANSKRDSVVFEKIFFALKAHLESLFPDSSRKKDSVYIIDSTTIKLFQEIFPGAGMSKENGKRKGGLKVHMAVQQASAAVGIVHLSAAATHDGVFIKHLGFPQGSTVIMDMGYRNFKQFNQWNREQITWVTRLHPYTAFKIQKSNRITQKEKKAGVKADLLITMGAELGKAEKVTCRLIKFKSPETNKTFSFITNDLYSGPACIAATYKKRWGIELLFKRLKQNMPLKYFLGDNQNAIKIQVWCALITDLLLQFIKRQLKRTWAYSNIVKLIRLHLFNYLNLISFLENPEKSIIRTTAHEWQLALNLSG